MVKVMMLMMMMVMMVMAMMMMVMTMVMIKGQRLVHLQLPATPQTFVVQLPPNVSNRSYPHPHFYPQAHPQHIQIPQTLVTVVSLKWKQNE